MISHASEVPNPVVVGGGWGLLSSEQRKREGGSEGGGAVPGKGPRQVNPRGEDVVPVTESILDAEDAGPAVHPLHPEPGGGAGG